MKDLLRRCGLDTVDAATSAPSLGRLNGTLGNHEEMGEC